MIFSFLELLPLTRYNNFYKKLDFERWQIMNPYSFRNDYSEGAHPNILKALIDTNLTQQEGYGEDDYCEEAINCIKNKLNNDKSDIHFVSGGTQANLIVISSALKRYESVISATTGHINVHETGAIESTGHKVNVIETNTGKLTASQIQKVLDIHTDEHMVKPKMVYISNSTEIGTVYTKNELEELYSFCKSNNLYLFMDGARLGSALCSKETNLKISDLPNLTDAFYIGGTKNGALLGETIVINNDNLKENFRFYIKQNGALLAKGRVLGIQFLELFKNDLFYDLANHANNMAYKIGETLEKLGFKFLNKPSSNQIFPILSNDLIENLSEKFLFYVWTEIDDNTSAIRLVTSWATKEEMVDLFIDEIKKHSNIIN